MASYLSPGVYMEEVSSGSRPIEAVGTAVAAFVGFAGRLEEPGALRLLRPQDVALDDAGPLRARVSRLVPVEDGVRVELTLEHGRLVALAPAPGPAPGAEVGVRLTGGVTFPR